jgi:parallel beta-helix repeat protein
MSLGIVGVAQPAFAANVSCGSTITQNTVLDGNVGPCSTGIAIGANNITFDLNGFTISGNPTTGDGGGIVLSGRSGVTVKNGTVTQFDAGVSVTGGSGNTVTNMNVLNNRGNFETDFGDGILVFNSTGNAITNNRVRNNGPYDGIGLLVANNNLVDSNQITDNNQASNNTAGIRLENIGRTPSSGNTVTNNLVTNSGTFGIEVFAGGSNNVIRNNQVVGNALDGITVFAGGNGNIIETNVTRSNGGSGIYIRGAAGNFAAPSNNQILRNQSFGNAVFDLRDGTPNCGTNQWHGNQGATGTPPCVFNP